jgi:hypothetical protein
MSTHLSCSCSPGLWNISKGAARFGKLALSVARMKMLHHLQMQKRHWQVLNEDLLQPLEERQVKFESPHTINPWCWTPASYAI